MIKKIALDLLHPGMYVHELGVSWLEHPFLRGCFKVDSATQIAQLRAAGITSVYIDTARGGDVPEAPTAEALRDELQAEVVRVATAPAGFKRHSSLAAELRRARQILGRLQKIVRDLFGDVRLGRAPTLYAADDLVGEIVESVARNSEALQLLARLRTKDAYTFHHSVSVCVMLVVMGRALAMEDDLARAIGLGGLVHDLGKAHIPDRVLKKRGRLTDDEFQLMRSHSEQGHGVLCATPGVGQVQLDIALHHHERIDGMGYPAGLAGPQIPRHVRLASIVDVYDALTSERCYHAAASPPEALRKMLEWSASQLDRELVQTFIRCVGIFPAGTLVRLESNRLAAVVDQNRADLTRPVVRVFFDARRNAPIPVFDLDLAQPGCADRIISDEAPEKWQLDPLRVLNAI